MKLDISRPHVAAVVLVAVAVGVFVRIARAATPADEDALVYSGVLENNGALVEGAQVIRVDVFDAPTGGASLCSVQNPATAVVHGRFRLAIPDCAAVVRASSGDLFVEVQVSGVAVGDRTRIGAVPFALEAAHATIADDVATLPADAVIAFNRASCPPGWSNFAGAVGRVVVGDGAAAGLTTRALGAQFGEERHALSLAELPAHHHTFGIKSPVDPNFQNDDNTLTATGGKLVASAFGSAVTDDAGGGQAHNVVQPSIALHYCVKD